MKSNAFGLDIGTSSIKAVWLSREKDTISLNSASSLPAPTPGMQSESPVDHQEVSQVINQLVNDAKITTNNVNIAISESHIFTKVIEMPFLSEKELSTAIYWEAEQYVPASLDTVALDYSVLRKPKDGKSDQKMQVLLVAAPHELIKKYQKILEVAGLALVSVEPETLSGIRGVLSQDSSPTSLIINIGSMTTSLSIVQDGVMVFNYYVALGGVALTRAIASAFGVAIDKAEEYKKIYGLSDKNFGGKVTAAIEPIFSSMIIEVKKAIAFYNEKYKNESLISQILLVGGGAKLPGIDVYFVRSTGIETVIANPWKMRDVRNVPEKLLDIGPEYAVAVGLALKEYEK